MLFRDYRWTASIGHADRRGVRRISLFDPLQGARHVDVAELCRTASAAHAGIGVFQRNFRGHKNTPPHLM